ncbi:MAG: hypothetical protein ACOYEF_00810 [Planifilum sp.]
MDWLEKWLSQIISGFAWMAIFIIIFWIILILILMFRELFTPDDRFHFREYLARVWRRLLISYEVISYGGLIVIPVLMSVAEEGVSTYWMMLVASIVFSAVDLYVRRYAGYWPWGKKWLP